MKRSSLVIAVLAFGLLALTGCSSDGDKIQPLSGQGAPSKGGSSSSSGPHPMPGGTKASGG